jgi:UDP-N-acetyl-2-amino-2-deoxyglucuronate dehydrogenase
MSKRGGGLTFALIGVAGYIARRHLAAIKECGGKLVAAFDVSDSVGQIDSCFPGARFFTEFERFGEYIERLRAAGTPVDYVVICSPNYLHKSHAAFAMRAGADAICEKPVVLEPSDIDGLTEIERSTGHKVNTILQLRLHPAIIELRRRIDADKSGRVFEAELTYVTARGHWYYESWKGKPDKSGGIATNIGVHFFDLLSFAFGRPTANVVHHRAIDCAAGCLEFERARVRWFLSINGRDKAPGDGFAQRSLAITDVGTYDFSKGFEDLHNISYREVLAKRGFALPAARPSIETVAHIRTAPVEPSKGWAHPQLAAVLGDAERYRDGYPV